MGMADGDVSNCLTYVKRQLDFSQPQRPAKPDLFKPDPSWSCSPVTVTAGESMPVRSVPPRFYFTIYLYNWIFLKIGFYFIYYNNFTLISQMIFVLFYWNGVDSNILTFFFLVLNSLWTHKKSDLFQLKSLNWQVVVSNFLKSIQFFLHLINVKLYISISVINNYLQVGYFSSNLRRREQLITS